jgi:hypothetical protein
MASVSGIVLELLWGHFMTLRWVAAVVGLLGPVMPGVAYHALADARSASAARSFLNELFGTAYDSSSNAQL